MWKAAKKYERFQIIITASERIFTVKIKIIHLSPLCGTSRISRYKPIQNHFFPFPFWGILPNHRRTYLPTMVNFVFIRGYYRIIVGQYTRHVNQKGSEISPFALPLNHSFFFFFFSLRKQMVIKNNNIELNTKNYVSNKKNVVVFWNRNVSDDFLVQQYNICFKLQFVS